MTTKTFGVDIEQMPYCCGFYEAGIIRWNGDDKYSEHQITTKDTVQQLQELGHGRPVIINFVQHHNYDGFEDKYEAQELMDAIQGQPGVVDLGTWINPGSDNRIHAFVIKGSAHEED